MCRLFAQCVAVPIWGVSMLVYPAPDPGKMEVFFFDATKKWCNTVHREMVHQTKGILFGDATKKSCNAVIKK